MAATPGDAGSRVGRWLRGSIPVRRLFLVGQFCLLLSLNTWLPSAIRGLLFLGAAVLLTWNLLLDRALFRRRPPRPPYQGQHDWPHDKATCGRCRWLRDGKQYDRP